MTISTVPTGFIPIADELLGSKVGPYVLQRRIGQGGMGVVYEARHEQIGQRAAVKVLMRDLARDPRILQRFLDEARTMTLVQHEGIVKVFDYGQLSDGVPYILMEFLEGMSLQERLKGSSEQSVGLPLPNAIEIARQVAGALAALHQKNIIHRDLKPDNLFLVPDSLVSGGQRVKLLDFGLAKVLSQEVHRTADGNILGTPLYMAPEQWQGGHRSGVKSDVYALGALFFELLVGHPPFHGGTPSELMYQHVNRQAPLLSELALEVPPQLDGLLALMLAKAPATRPRMEDVAQLLEPVRRESETRGPLALWGNRPVHVGEHETDGLSDTLGPQPVKIEKEGVTENRLGASLASEALPGVIAAPAPALVPTPAVVPAPTVERTPTPERTAPPVDAEGGGTKLSPPSAAARSSSLSAISVSVAPVRRHALWPFITAGIVGLVLMTVLGVALRRQRHPKESLGTTPVSAPHSAATPTVPVELPPPVATPQPIAAPRPGAVPVAVTVEPPSLDESAESSRKFNKRKRRSRSNAHDVPASPKTDEPMTIFREH